jgi:type III restriction enzyme
MNACIFNAIVGRLSLCPPQRESLQRLAQALDAAPAMLEHEPD